MIRYGFNTDQIMVNIVTAYEDIEKLEPIVKILKNDIPEVTTIINNINTKKLMFLTANMKSFYTAIEL